MSTTFKSEVETICRKYENKAQWENSKESMFTTFRRSCMNMKQQQVQSGEGGSVLDTNIFAPERTAVWHLLLDLSKSKLRRKHVIECVAVLANSAIWMDTLNEEPSLQSKLSNLPSDVQVGILSVEKSQAIFSGKNASEAVSNAQTVTNDVTWDNVKKKKKHSPKQTLSRAASNLPPVIDNHIKSEIAKPHINSINNTRMSISLLPEFTTATNNESTSKIFETVADSKVEPATSLPVKHLPNNPFVEDDDSEVEVTGKFIDPENMKWWEDEPKKASKGLDYQHMYLMYKAKQIQETQQRIIRQQQDILSMNQTRSYVLVSLRKIPR